MGDLGFSRRVGRQASHTKRCRNCLRYIVNSLPEHRQHCERTVQRLSALAKFVERMKRLMPQKEVA